MYWLKVIDHLEGLECHYLFPYE